MRHQRNAAFGSHEAGVVAVEFERAPVVDGRQQPGALVTRIVERGANPDGERVDRIMADWPDGVYVDCPLTLAEALNGLLDAVGHEALAEAAVVRLGAGLAALDGLIEEMWRGYRFGVGGTAHDDSELPERVADMPPRQRNGWRCAALRSLGLARLDIGSVLNDFLDGLRRYGSKETESRILRFGASVGLRWSHAEDRYEVRR